MQELFCGQTRAWGYEYALAEMLMMYSQILTSALEIVRDYLWNFTMARTHLQKSFVLVMHRSGKLRYFVSNFHIKADLRAHSALQQVIIFQKQPIFWHKRFASFGGRNQGQDGLLFAKSLLSHSLMHLAVVSVLRTIGFPSSIQTSKLKFYLFRTILKY